MQNFCYFSFETTKDLRNRQNSLSKSMLKATGSLLQGDALLIKSSIGIASSKTPEDNPNIAVEPSRNFTMDCAGDINTKELANQQTKQKLKTKDKPLEKDLKNASNYDDIRKEGRSDYRVTEKEDILDKDNDDKTPTNEISISSINDMTDNSILKESMESEKQVMILADDLKTDLIMADEEKDDDNSERNKFVNAWVSRLACEEKGTYLLLYIVVLMNDLSIAHLCEGYENSELHTVLIGISLRCCKDWLTIPRSCDDLPASFTGTRNV